MEHAKRLEICELCTNKDFSPKSGVVCSLTSQKPAFEESCNNFSLDTQMIAKKRRLEEGHDRLLDNSGSGGTVVGGGPSPARVIISVVVAILLVLRLLMRCSEM